MKLPNSYNNENIELWRYWLDTVTTEASDKLNDWENYFIDSISLQLYGRGTLSEKQVEILERIYAKYTK